MGSNRRINHQTLSTNRAVFHPNYVESVNFRINDIGIVFLSQPVQLSQGISPILLPSINEDSQALLNVQGMVLGYAGATTNGTEGLQNLQAAHVRIIDHPTCLRSHPKADVNQQYCAEDAEQRSNFCLGDQVNYFKKSLSQF